VEAAEGGPGGLGAAAARQQADLNATLARGVHGMAVAGQVTSREAHRRGAGAGQSSAPRQMPGMTL
jgi:hypothetical protein